MFNKIAFPLLSAVLVWALAACSPASSLDSASSAIGGAAAAEPALQRNAAGYIDIDSAQLDAMLEHKDFTLVNVHIPYEGELPQTDLFIAFDEIAQHTDLLPGKDTPIVLYCRSGRMSAEAAETLARLGYTNVYELDGGFVDWEAAGHDLLHQP